MRDLAAAFACDKPLGHSDEQGKPNKEYDAISQRPTDDTSLARIPAFEFSDDRIDHSLGHGVHLVVNETESINGRLRERSAVDLDLFGSWGDIRRDVLLQIRAELLVKDSIVIRQGIGKLVVAVAQ